MIPTTPPLILKPHEPAIISNKVDFPVPLSPEIINIGFFISRLKLPLFKNGIEKGYNVEDFLLSFILIFDKKGD